MTTALHFASLYDGQEVFVWSDCLLDLGTDFLVGNMVLQAEIRQGKISGSTPSKKKAVFCPVQTLWRELLIVLGSL